MTGQYFQVRDAVGKYAFPLLLLLTFCHQVCAQEDPLERTLTLTIDQTRIEDALYLISETGEFNFCYNSLIIPADSIVSIHATGDRVDRILARMFGDRLSFISIGNHVVIRQSDRENMTDRINVSGTVTDNRIGGGVSGAMVFENLHWRSCRTDLKGQFALSIPASDRSLALNVYRPGYRDTSIFIIPNKDLHLILALTPGLGVEPIDAKLPDGVQRTDAAVLGGDEGILEPIARHTYYNRREVPVQISVIPLIGTNGINKIGTDNYLSFNLIAGMTKGLNGLEIGLLLNANRNQMQGIQFSGVVNITGKDGMGVQVAQGYNYVGGRFFGLQIGGIGNHVRGEFSGVQFSMGYNLSLDKFTGWQMAGAANYVPKDFTGFQIAGGTNIVTGEFKGMQVSGLVNYAKKMNGFQFGLINVSDTLVGASIGLMTISKNGYIRLEMQGTDVLHTGIRFKSGARYFYTIVEGGVRWSPQIAYGIGYGFGTRIGFAKRLFCEFEFDNLYLKEDRGPGFKINTVVRFMPTIGVHVAGPMEIHLGPTFTYHYSVLRNASDNSFSSGLGLSPFYRSEDHSSLQQLWVGVKGGVQFDLNWKRPTK